MGLAEKLRKLLADEYGINIDEELAKAIEKQKPVDLGIFTQGAYDENKKVG